MGYCEEHDDLTVTEDGTIRRDRKDWSTYRKSNAFVLAYLSLMALAIAAAIFGCSFVGKFLTLKRTSLFRFLEHFSNFFCSYQEHH